MSQQLIDLLNSVNGTLTEAMSGVQDYVSFTLQKSYFQCGYHCCSKDNPKLSQQQLQRCLEKCSEPMERAQAVIQHEIGSFQERLQRSMLACKDRLEIAGTVVLDEEKQQEMERCMDHSVREHLKTIPQLASSIRSKITAKGTEGL